jgi:hypothetical protein
MGGAALTFDESLYAMYAMYVCLYECMYEFHAPSAGVNGAFSIVLDICTRAPVRACLVYTAASPASRLSIPA